MAATALYRDGFATDACSADRFAFIAGLPAVSMHIGTTLQCAREAVASRVTRLRSPMVGGLAMRPQARPLIHNPSRPANPRSFP